MDNNENKKETPGKIVRNFVIAIVVIAVFFIGIFFLSNYLRYCKENPMDTQKPGINESDSQAVSKQAPTVSFDQTMLNLIFNIQCNDDYDYVILRVSLLDENQAELKTFTLREDNLRRGELRQATYTPGLNEIWNSSQVKYRILEYR